MVPANSLHNKWLLKIEERVEEIEAIIDDHLDKKYDGPGKEIVIPLKINQLEADLIIKKYSEKEGGWKVASNHDSKENDFLLKFSH